MRVTYIHAVEIRSFIIVVLKLRRALRFCPSPPQGATVSNGPDVIACRSSVRRGFRYFRTHAGFSKIVEDIRKMTA